MNDQIVKVVDIQAMAREDFARGRQRHEHNMNWHAAALPTWLAEWDRCAAHTHKTRGMLLNLGMVVAGRPAGGSGQP